MSRAMNISATEDEIRCACEAKSIRISAIEVLPGGGTHVVCVTSEGAEELRGVFSVKLIAGKVKRFAFYRQASGW